MQSVPPTTWYRLVAGLNAQLRLVRHGRLRVTFRPLIRWLERYANPALGVYHVRVDLAWFQATACGYCHYGLLVYAIEEENDLTSLTRFGQAIREQQFRYLSRNLSLLVMLQCYFLDSFFEICRMFVGMYTVFAHFGLYFHIDLLVTALLMTL